MPFSLAASFLLAGAALSSPYDTMPDRPGPEKAIKDYTLQDVIGCVFGRNKDQPANHPLRVKEPGAKLKAEWPGAKEPANLDPIIALILKAEDRSDEETLGEAIYWLLYEVMDVPKTEMGAAFQRVYAAQTEQTARRKVAFLGNLLFPFLADERLLAALKDMLDDTTVYHTERAEGAPPLKTLVRSQARFLINGFIYDDSTLHMGYPEDKSMIGDHDEQEMIDAGKDGARTSALMKAWLDAHWAEVVAKCAEVRAKPDKDRHFPGPAARRVLAPLEPEPNQ